MFWNVIRWGGTVLVMVLVLATYLLTSGPEEAATPIQPLETQAQPNKNFNLQ